MARSCYAITLSHSEFAFQHHLRITEEQLVQLDGVLSALVGE